MNIEQLIKQKSELEQALEQAKSELRTLGGQLEACKANIRYESVRLLVGKKVQLRYDDAGRFGNRLGVLESTRKTFCFVRFDEGLFRFPINNILLEGDSRSHWMQEQAGAKAR